jgi:hypothetical protein
MSPCGDPPIALTFLLILMPAHTQRDTQSYTKKRNTYTD